MNLMHTTFASALEVLRGQNIDCLMVGGHVVNYYGYARLTGDLDFMMVITDVDAMIRAMRTAGFTSYSVDSLVLFFKKPEPAIRVDFIRIDSKTFEKLMCSAITANIMGCQVKIPSLDDLLAMKFFSYAQSPSYRGKDLQDIVWLSIENKLAPEVVLRPLALKYANETIYQQVCAMLPQNTGRKPS